MTSHEDGDQSRLYFGKSYIFPLFAAPFVFLFGTNGFLVLNALLMTACFACAYAFLAARSQPVAALIFALAFLFLSVAPVYMVQIMPDFFNLALVLIGYFFWCYKEALTEADETAARVGPFSGGCSAHDPTSWPRLVLGVVTFSKPTNVLLIAPLLVSAALRRQWRRVFVIGGVFGAVVVALFALNIAITGEWNYQGGNRRTFYSNAINGDPSKGGFPFQDERHTFDSVGLGRTTNRLAVEVLVSRDAVIDVFRHNLAYFFFGRHTGFAVYYFPGLHGGAAVSRGHSRSGRVAVAHPGGRAGFGRCADSLHAVHLLGRRRSGRQSILLGRLPSLPVHRAGAAAQLQQPGHRRHQRALYGADRDRILSTRRSTPASTAKSVSSRCCRSS